MRKERMSRLYRKYKQGEADYALAKPRPDADENERRLSRAGARRLGWMMMRARAVVKIIDELKAWDADQIEDYDRIITRRVDDLDRKLGLIPENLFHLV